jgi:hypothetical protein
MPKKTKQTKKAIKPTTKPTTKPAAQTVSNPPKTSTVRFPGNTW